MPPHRYLLKLTKAQKTLLLGITLSGLMLLVAVFSKEGFLTVREFEKELGALVQKNRELERENKRLIGQIKALKSDPFEVERLAREKLNLVRPGEVVYQIVPPGTGQPAPTSSP